MTAEAKRRKVADGPTTRRTRLVLFGDSLTQQGFSPGGWVARLCDRYCRRADVFNRGYSGYNTRWSLPVIEQLVADGVGQGAGLWTVFFGANDAAQPAQHRQHVPLEEYEANLATILRRIREASPEARIVVITPPPLDEAKWLAYMQKRNPALAVSDRTDAEAGRYATAAARAAAAGGAEVLNLYEALKSQGSPAGSFLGDGLHFNEAGQELVFKLLMALVEEKLPELMVHPDVLGGCHNSGSSSALPQEFPWHDQVTAQPPHHPLLERPAP